MEADPRRNNAATGIGGDDEPVSEAAPAVTPLDERHPNLWWVGERFALLVDALRDMTDEFVPHVEAIDRSRLTPDALAAMDALSAPRRDRLREAVALALDEEPEDADEAKGRKQRVQEAFHDAFRGDRHLISTFLDSLGATAAGPDRVSIMRNSLLLQLVSAFEVFIAGVATRFFVTQPQALQSQEKEFSLAELQSFADIEDAVDALIARRVANLMRGDLDDWAAWLKTRYKADLPRLAHDWPFVCECFQRRHVIVHNGGLVSRQYLSKVPSELADGLVVGSRLRVHDEYLGKAFDELDIVGASIIVAARSTCEPDQIDEIGGMLLRRTYALLLRGRWVAVAKLCGMRQFVKAKASVREALRANELCAKARISGAASVYADARDWDVSASAARFQLVRSVLMEDFDEAFDRIPKMVANEELSLGELQSWPILEPVRSDSRWESLAQASGISQDEATSAELEDHGPLASDVIT